MSIFKLSKRVIFMVLQNYKQGNSLPKIAFTASNETKFSTSSFPCTRIEHSFKNIRNNDPKLTLFTSLLKNSALDNTEWEAFRLSLLEADKSIKAINIDGIIMGYCVSNNQLDTAKSYMSHLNFIGTGPNIATVGKLLKLYYLTYHEKPLPDNDQKEVLSWVKELSKMENLDATTCENLIYGLCITPQWEKSLIYLSMIELTCTPSGSTYSVIIEAANRNNDSKTALKLMEQMVSNSRIPKCVVFTSWLDYCTRVFTHQLLLENVEKMLQFIANNDIKISRIVTDKLITVFEGLKWSGHYSFVNPSGQCSSCCKMLIPISFSHEDFFGLREEFLNRVLVRGNAFVRTTPKELEDFMNFIHARAPYNVIIDGLNVAYSAGRNKKKPNDLIHMVSAVVRHFAEKNQKILVLGRKHMKKWPSKGIEEVNKNADIFLTEDMSYDDPYLLYAALYSGPDTHFVSRDLMRSHSFLLEDRALRTCFKKWQQKQQYQLISVTKSKVLFKEPLVYLPTAHKTHNSWHIPYVEEYTANPAQNLDAPVHWLCLHNNSLT